MSKQQQTVSVVFVCMGNICRSPTAEGVFRKVVKDRNLHDSVRIDSAGTHAYHVGEQPDSRAQATAHERGLDLSAQRARKIEADDFVRFDYVIAMDRANLDALRAVQRQSESDNSRLYLFMDFAKDWPQDEVPDPYYGGSNGFESVFDMVESASHGLLQHILDNDL